MDHTKLFKQAWHAAIASILTLSAVFGCQNSYGQPTVPTAATAGSSLSLSNDAVTLVIDPAQGGAITTMRFKQAMTFPYIADRGAGVAGEGRFFTPIISVDGKKIDLSAIATRLMSGPAGKGEQILRLSADLSAAAKGLSIERHYRLAANESGLRISDVFKNDGKAEITFRIGSNSRQEGDQWRQTRRMWIGDAQQSFAKFSPNPERDLIFTAQNPRLFWRNIGQYGTGYLYQVTAPATPVDVVASCPRESGMPAELTWQAAEVKLAPGKSISIESAILIDEGGRQSNEQMALAATDRLIVTTDLRAGGWSGQPIPGTGTVVSAIARQVVMLISQQYEEQGTLGAAQEVIRKTLDLQPGQAKVINFELVPTKSGVICVTVTILKPEGDKSLQSSEMSGLASSRSYAVIDGKGLTGKYAQQWKIFDTSMPESVQKLTIAELKLQGSWHQIGTQLAQAGRAVVEDSAMGAESLAFYRQRFPFYAQMLEGAAAQLGAAPERVIIMQESEPPGIACMDTFYNGPDGPINAFSKERSGPGLGGLTYTKVLPTKGYRFHVYMGGCGVNSEGLSVSTATLNEDAKTTAAGAAFTKQWEADGKKIIGNGRFIMLATCKDVNEAMAFIEHPQARDLFTGNMLLVDRAGNAARVESVGVLRNVHRYNAKADEGFCVAGNYAHPNKDGLFNPGGFGWAVNTMLREHWLKKNYGDRRDNLSLRDVFTIMGSHEPGGQCQHIFDNPGALYSSCHFIAVSRTSDLWLSHGPPCRVKYVKYSLKDDAPVNAN